MPITCYLLSPRGFCSGVTRAVNMTEQVLKLYGSVYVTEDIIHNKIFMNNMVGKGIIKVSSLDDVPNGAVVLFSAHGISPQVVEKAEKKELTIIDATCPIVKAIQMEAQKAAEAGKKIVIIGNRAHAEIIALIGYTKNSEAFVVHDEIEIELLPNFLSDKVIYFTQTTLDCLQVQSIVKKLKEHIPHIESNSQGNICYAAKGRQDAIRSIANSVDLLIILGSSHSSNARRLLEVALTSGAQKAVLIDSKDDLDEKMLKNIRTMAVTSAASTPENIVQDLIKHLNEKLDINVENFELPEKDE